MVLVLSFIMAGVIVKNVPFSSWEEWVRAKSFLFSSNRTDQLSGLQLVHVWRCRGSLPAAVECTAQLVEANMLDVASSGSRLMTHQSAESTRMLLSLAILRAVNIVIEPNQQGYYAMPVAQLADKVGLPGWIVELRHDATHRHLPTLELLRSASQFLLEWFWQNYWEMQWKELQILSQVCIDCAADQNIKVVKAHFKQPTFLSSILIPLILSDIKNSSNSKSKGKVGSKKWLKILSSDEHASDMLKVSILTELNRQILSNSDKSSLDEKKVVASLVAHYQQLVEGQSIAETTTPWKQLLQSKSNQLTLCAANELANVVRWSESCSTEDDIGELLRFLTSAEYNKTEEESIQPTSTSNQVDLSMKETRNISGQKRKMIDKVETNKKKSRSSSAYQRLHHPEPIQDIQILNNYGIWPIGLVAGRTDCSELWQLEVVVNDHETATTSSSSTK